MKIFKISMVAFATVFATTFSLTGCTMPDMTGTAAPSNASSTDEAEAIEFVQLKEIEDGAEIAIIETTVGNVKMVLFPNEAPNTVTYFKKLVNDGFYNGKGIVMESGTNAFITGATDDKGLKGEVSTPDGKKIEAEVTQNLWHFSGAVSAWCEEKNRFSKTRLSDSRFFVIGDIEASADIIKQMEEYEYPQSVIDEYKKHGGMPQYTGLFTVFAQVYEGMDVVNEILSTQVGEVAETIEDIVIEKVTLGKYEKE